MNRVALLVGFVAVLALGVVIGRWTHQSPVSAQGVPGGGAADLGCAYSTGDANGDHTINIADPVYVLNWLFMGGPPCVAPCTCPLPATGQTKCYNNTAEIACPADPRLPFGGQDGFYQAGCPKAGRFEDMGDGTITDHCTGLMWAKRMAKPSSAYGPTADDRVMWEEALSFCRDLGDVLGADTEFNGAGHKDWRLPNVRELQSIIDYGRLVPNADPLKQGKPALDPVFDIPDLETIQPSRPYGEFWTSTTGGWNPQRTYVVGLNYGQTLSDYFDGNTGFHGVTKTTNSFWVLPVRTILPGE